MLLCRFEMGMSSGVSTTASQQGGTPQQSGLQPEPSTASVSMPAAAQPHSTPRLHPGHQHASEAGQGFSAWYQQTDSAQQAAHAASQQAHATVSVRSWPNAEQPGSPIANPRASSAGGVDTPKTLQLKALVAQAERLQQVGAARSLLHCSLIAAK